MAAELRVGIAGTGFIGGVHARSARLAGARVVAVAASSPESAAAAAHALHADRAVASAEELVVDTELDVVHICTPNHLHLPLAEAALAAGKHVVCEKPLAVSADGAERLVAAAADSGRQAAVPFVYRFYPTVREARERVRTGETGPLHLLHGTYLQDWMLRPEDDNWRVDENLGGASRAFADIGSHWCDLAEFITGQRLVRLSARTLTTVDERVHASGRKAFGAGDASGEMRKVTTEDAAIVQFETDGGALGSAVISQVSAGRKNRLWIEIDGSHEALAFDQEQPEQLWSGRRDTETIVRRDPESLSPAAARYATLPGGHPQGYADCFDGFVADFYEAIRTGLAPDGLPVFADGLRATRITEAVLASAATGEWVDIPAVREAVAPMKLGFLSACMPERSLEDIAAWAAANGYEALELAAWPGLGDRPFTASHVAADAFDDAEAERVRAALEGNGLVPVRARLLRQQPPPRPVGARGRAHPCARVHRRRRGARRACPWAPSSAATPAAAWPRTCARPSASSRRWSTTPASAGCG